MGDSEVLHYPDDAVLLAKNNSAQIHISLENETNDKVKNTIVMEIGSL